MLYYNIGIFCGIYLSFIYIMIFVAFYILSERKLLGYVQLRKGPNKVGILGLFQSFADLIKLIIKLKFNGFLGRSNIALLGVVLIIIISFFYVSLYYYIISGYKYNYSLLIFLVITSISSYSLLLVGWGSFNKYSLYGSLRAAFGSVSFEASLMCLVLIFGFYWNNYSMFIGGVNNLILFGLIPFYFMWLICILCETNRTPFDYAESESDLVSGFNVEYCNTYFTCLFACEYLIIYIMSWFVSVIFVNNWLFGLLTFFNVFIVLWVRGTLPRVRFDNYINFMWGQLLLISAFYLGIILF
uniref:NADH-ubiquinone oxidoreductase chain 1 n=1 Tax=Lepidotrema longipenis TaxID=330067 RepID=A0A346Q024_9PLAT|nr:NADH dehydrogenase subunit 1 [Lepidotrema longipenis]AXR86350.1 NADH dehydrogenase subunit 1 [Lepidotrema longipenis]